jgi:integrase
MSSDHEYLTVRDGVWQFYRRVPSHFGHLDKRGTVKLSTKIKVAKDRTGAKASRVAARLNDTLEAYWRGLSEQTAANALRAYDDAVKLARSFGVDYLQPSEWAAKSFHEVRARVQAVMNDGRIEDHPAKRRAIMGGVEKPGIMLSSLFSTYDTIQSVGIAGRSERQRQKWTTQYQRAAQIFIDKIGDKPLEHVSRDDAVAYAEWWESRVLNDGIEIGTMNKNLGHLSSMFRAVIKRHKLRLDNPFAGLRQEGGKEVSRPPFPTEFIRDVVLAPGKLDGLNDDARDLVYLIMETGARPSELANLTRDRIKLTANIPHIRVDAHERDNDTPGRELKTEQSKRDIPLVGLALEAMRGHPDGFTRYFDKADNFSAAANKYFKKNKLLPTPRHTIYSLRHSFKDRLKDVECPEEMIDELMGHKIDKPKYGDGYGLQLKLKNIQAIAFTSRRAVKAA